ncbi:MAG: restriction endonuclease subunit S [Clostridia bacterium]|nr:restriction endonuclease subunit S [Clostridia bacterium]
MGKLEELIKELCPNGVEYTTVGKICNISRGVVLSKDYIRDNIGEYPVYSSQTENDGCLGCINSYKYDGEYITWTTDGANAGTIFYRTGKFNITNVCGLLEVIDESVLIKFLFYVLSVEANKHVSAGMGNPKLMSNVMASIKIPLPPLAVQREIVQILDKFTLLSAELTAELTARRKQYEFYRDKLLQYDITIPKHLLTEIFDTRNGYTPSTNNKEFWESNDLPWFRMEDIRENGRILNDAIQHVSFSAVKGKPFPANSIIVSTSATIGEHALITCESLANQRFTYLMLKDEFKQKYNIKFLFYYCYLLDEYCKNNLNQGSFASVDMKKFNNFEFPLPPLDVQERIVNVLENFDAICSDLGIGLPAEIEKRQQQYEYYRDKLLTFDLSSTTIYQTDRQTDRQTP